MIHNTKEFYYKIAVALSYKAVEGRFDNSEIVELEIDGELVSVGPFNEIEHWGSSHFVFSFPDTDFAVGMSGDDWDSWGNMYDDNHNNFDVYAKTNPRIIYDIEAVYDFDKTLQQEFPFPPIGNRW